MRHWVVAVSALIGANAAGVAWAGSPGGVDVAAAALQPAAPPATIRRVDASQVVPGPDDTCDPSGLCLRITLGTDLASTACGDRNNLNVAPGDQVNFCYTVTNNSDTTFQYQTASDNVGRAERQLFIAFKHTIEPHATYRFNRIETMRETQRVVTTWTATAEVPEYSHDDTVPFDFVDIAGEGTDLDISDLAQTSVEMPFAFNFYGIPSRYLAVSASAVAFGSAYSAYIAPWGYDLPTPCVAYAAVCPMILPFGMNIFSGVFGGGVYTQTLGIAPNRRFVVQWNDQPALAIVGNRSWQTLGGVTYELILEEGSDELLFQYRDTSFDDPEYPDADDGAIAVVGLNFGGMPSSETVGAVYSRNAPALHEGLAVRWTPGVAITSRASASATVSVFAPSLMLDSQRIDAAVAAGGSTTSSLLLSNRSGQPAGVLRWNFGLPDSAAHLPLGAREEIAHAGPAVELPLSAVPQFLRARADENARQKAAGSPLRYPLPQRRATTEAHPIAAPGGSGVPAYAALEIFDPGSDFIDEQQLARWDLAAPQAVTPVSEVFTTQRLFATYKVLLDFMDDDFTTLYTMNGPDLMAFDTSSGVGVPVRRFDLPSQIYVQSFNYLPSERVFYSLMCTQYQFNCHLYKLDPNTGAVEQGPNLNLEGGLIVSLALAATGEMYAATLQPGGQLVAIDRVTGAARIVGDMHVLSDAGFLVAWSMDFDDRAGILYLSAIDPNSMEIVVHTVDTTTGLASEVGRYGGALAGAMQGLAIATSAPLGGCTDLATTPWLHVEPSSGEAGYGETVNVDVVFDANGLADGVYAATLCLNSNDPDRRHVFIPTMLTVGGGDAIFRNGFD